MSRSRRKQDSAFVESVETALILQVAGGSRTLQMAEAVLLQSADSALLRLREAALLLSAEAARFCYRRKSHFLNPHVQVQAQAGQRIC
jgi:hypothetical protein